MKIICARHIGYCMGVKRAMNLAFQALSRERGRSVYSFGPLIHNLPALKLLESKGLSIYDPAFPPPPGSTVIIRAHGLPPEKERELMASGVKVIDATCPKVARVQRKVAEAAASGARVVVWGSAGHPEVEGLLGYARGRGTVASGPEEIAELPEDWDWVFLAAQTTQDTAGWEKAAEAAERRWPGRVDYLNSICEATEDRQRSVAELCREVSALVVVGGRDSANTRRLYELGVRSGVRAVAVEGPEEIPAGFTEGLASVGVASGASTPIWQLRMVYQALGSLGRSSERTLASFFGRFFRALALSFIYRAAGGAAVGWALAGAAGYDPPGLFFALFFYFALAVNLFNGFIDRDSSRFNDPDRSAFFSKYRGPLVCAGLLSFTLAMAAAHALGRWMVVFLAVQTVLAVLYAIPYPLEFFKERGLRGVKDMPGGKTLSTAAGKAVLLSFPALLVEPPLIPLDPMGLAAAMCAAALVFVHIFVRNYLMDLQEARGDRSFGPGSIALLLGARRSARFLVTVMALWALAIPAAWLAGLMRPEVLLFLVTGPLYNAFVLTRFMKAPGLGGFQFDLYLDGQFLLAGILSVAFHAALGA
ncbi:MAG: 4-hydroxy-3-methylbut-2-enyl diphosphate reductase [Deltaproteobacteria bacterium]|nr:4-hydroxy-3-methylbut-2-enyl diphosphate reductase [Deltaproteobacteria bacterium]